MAKKSKFKVNVGSKSKIIIDWRDKPENYSNESKKHIISIMSDRYSIPKESIKIEFTPIKYNEKGEIIDVSTDVINNIQDPKFQIKLFNDYLTENNIVDVDFEFIKKIDSEINSKIDYDVYDKYRKYEIEWVKWDNFLSYGSNNSFDFTKLKGLTIVNGQPGNMNGKSSFTIDLISFLLFGKTQKPYTLSECFNKFTNEKTFHVSGCIKIDGVSYIIERNVTRAKKRTGEWGDASQEVKYYEVINGNKEELSDFNKNSAGEYSSKTNKIIKESIGSEKDFNMIISANGNDLDSLIDIGITERGRLLSKWIGLLPLEEKDKIAKDVYKSFEKTLKSRLYNETDLTNELNLAKKSIDDNNNNLLISQKRLNELDSLIIKEQELKDSLLSSKRVIDVNILKLDIYSVNEKMKNIEISANNKKKELELRNDEFKKVEDINFNNDDYKQLLNLDKEYSIKINDIKNEIKRLKETNKDLLEKESCPTCHRKYENADNSGIIKTNETKINELTQNGIKINSQLELNKGNINLMESNRVKYDQKLKLQNLIEIIPVQIENLRNEYREKKQLIKEYDENKNAIDLNNKIDISLTNVNSKLNSYLIEKNSIIKEIEHYNRNILELNKTIEKNDIILKEISIEFNKIKNWNIYLDMIGKNGISKMVLRKTLPIINSEISRILDDVCEFDIEVVLTDKNDVIFKIIKDGVSSNLAGASGFERTASALALRHVLGNISTMPRPNFITFDEILGKVAKENYDNMRKLYNKIENTYQFILHISHIEDIVDWHTNTIQIKKENNISSIKTIINNKIY